MDDFNSRGDQSTTRVQRSVLARRTARLWASYLRTAGILE